MFNSDQFKKLDFDVFSKKQLKENSLRSIFGGAEETSNRTFYDYGGFVKVPYDTIYDDGCTKYHSSPNEPATCDSEATE